MQTYVVQVWTFRWEAGKMPKCWLVAPWVHRHALTLIHMYVCIQKCISCSHTHESNSAVQNMANDKYVLTLPNKAIIEIFASIHM